MSHRNSQPDITANIPASVRGISEEGLQQFSKRVCERCHELGLPTVVERTKSALSQDTCIGVKDSDAKVLLQRILFDLDYPFVQDCPICCEIERASRKSFKFNAPTSHSSAIGRDENWFEFSRSNRWISHHSPGEKRNNIWTIIDYFGIATPTSFPIGHSARSYTARKVSLHMPDYSLLLKCLIIAPIITRYPIRPSPSVDYIALSYVWGFSLGPLCVELPATIEDAIQVTRNLRQQYIWVDYVCIDQKDSERTTKQIKLMDDIYSVSLMTIIALDGLAASDGLPRVGSSSRVVSQEIVNFGRGNLLVSFFPSLDIKLRKSTWITRGWTFQEGVLCNRRLIFTNEQVYYLCNHMSCSESFNFVDKDGFEDPRVDDRTAYYCCLRNPLIPKSQDDGPQRAFEDTITHYVVRELGKQSDTLNAVTGLLKRLENDSFPDGFVCGIPSRNFRFSLLWTTNLMGERDFVNQADCTHRKNYFPSWSWAGWIWKVPLRWVVRPWGLGCNWCCILQPPLHLWMETGEEIKPDAMKHCHNILRILVEPPKAVISDINTLIKGSLPLLETIPIPDDYAAGLLTVQGLVLKLEIVLSEYTSLTPYPDVSGEWHVHETVHERIGLSPDYYRMLEWTNFEYSGQIPHKRFLSKNVPQQVDFLLVAFSYNTTTGRPRTSLGNGETWTKEDEARDNERASLCLHLLLLQWENKIAFRAGMATLEVKNTNILNLLKTSPRLSKFKLG